MYSELVQTYHNFSDVVELSVECFPNNIPPSQQGIQKLNKTFEQIEVGTLLCSCRLISVSTEENLDVVMHCFVQSPIKSTSPMEYGIPKTSLQKDA